MAEKMATRLCPHCGNVTPHEMLYKCSAPRTWYNSDGSVSSDPNEPGADYILLRCRTCRDVSLYSKLQPLGWDEGELEYPAGYHLDSCIPETVAANYREAKRVQNMSPNAFAVLLRRALEALCDDKGVGRGTLGVRLRQLADRGDIPGKLAEVTAALRELGNAGAHHTAQRVTVPMTWTMDKFFRTLVEYVYVAPHRVEEFQKSLKEYESGEQDSDTE